VGVFPAERGSLCCSEVIAIEKAAGENQVIITFKSFLPAARSEK